MSVYVDPLQVWPNAWGIFRAGSCHLAADTIEELHEFAAKLGMKREWFQDHPKHPHYDLVKSRRERAVALGAKEVTSRELVNVWRRATGRPER